MIVSFYDSNFKGTTNNASLRVDSKSFKLIKRPIELNELSCTCEAFSQDMQPTFLVIGDARDRYVYGSLAGVPVVNSDNKTEITGTDIKSMLSSDVILDQTSFDDVNDALEYVFDQWDTQVNQGSFNCELVYTDNFGTLAINSNGLVPYYEKGVYNALEEMQSILRYYNLYLDTKLDIPNAKIKFIIGKTMQTPVNVKLWEYGIKNYGKLFADVNECQGYLVTTENDVETWIAGYKWVLTTSGDVTLAPSANRILPIKKKIVTSNENITEANMEALKTLLDTKYGEDIELPASVIKPSFETLFNVYTERGGGLYKQLPCGELRYDGTNTLVKFKIGYRYTGVNFI